MNTQAILERTCDTDIENYSPTSNPRTYEKAKGRLSIISGYCREAINQGHERCVWLCFKRNGKVIARDV